MQTMEVVEDRKKVILDEKKQFLEDIIKAAARYERLLTNKDFQDVLSDLRTIADLHDKEVKVYLTMYTSASSFFKKIRFAEVMSQHQSKKETIEEAVNYPSLIVQKAEIAREELAKLKIQEKENENV